MVWHSDEESNVMCQALCILSLGVEGWRQEEGGEEGENEIGRGDREEESTETV